ncbi:hypothetical protein F1C12_00415 [Leifsonia shinshuensis]|uniref:Uncharacterized protein n=2 Tax=Leifsonia shinshuensis TaxID=150026 RepID=A0A7G6YG36_9MICO|nr:hypothetical protein F1C12_00415 [Leifsonia shinshuensis]
MQYVRFRATTVNRRGIRPGVFALVNGLARDGRLSPVDRRFWRSANDWFAARVIDPASVDPGIFIAHPLSVSWFDAGAEDLLDRIPGYLRILDRHGIGWERRVTRDPGVVVYSDPDQVLATPRE